MAMAMAMAAALGGCARANLADTSGTAYPDIDVRVPPAPPPPPGPDGPAACEGTALALKLGDALLIPGNACDLPNSRQDASYSVKTEQDDGRMTFWIRVGSHEWDDASVDCSGGTITSITIYAPSLAPACLAALLDPRMGVAWQDAVSAEFGVHSKLGPEIGEVATSAPRGVQLYVVPGVRGNLPVVRLARPTAP